MGERYDFCGYATKNDLLCEDGRIIRRDAFKGCDGITVPLVWNHRHDDPEMVLGHALLENRPDGVFMYGKFNDTEKGKACKKILDNKDIKGLSIYANHLKQKAGDVLHGVIREVSLVLGGANPGATIDFALSHSDEGYDGEVYAYLVGDEFTELRHGADIDELEEKKKKAEEAKKEEETSEKESPESEEEPEKSKEEPKEAKKEDQKMANRDEERNPQNAKGSGKTVKDVLDTLNEEQKTAVYALLAALSDEDEDDDEDDDEPKNNRGDKEMKHNAFENNEYGTNYLSHSDMEAIFKDAKRLGSLREAVTEHQESGVLAHSVDGPDDYGVSRGTGTAGYGVYDPTMLFPEFKSIDPTPQFIKRDTDWVADFIASVKHTPFSRIKTIAADITEDDARALGYIKGKIKKDEFFKLIKRTTDPQTIYKKQKMDRDDVIDITDFDVVAWIRSEMRVMLDEEIARACLIGDGRLASSDDKISESHIRPIATDSDLFSVKVPVTQGTDDEATAKAFIRAAIRARKDYKGSGNPILYITDSMLANILLIEDGIGHLLYANEQQLMTTLRVRKIVTCPVMDGTTIPISASGSTTNKQLLGIIVNPQDYVIGADKGGAVNMFDDFDIDYNQQKYLIETRISGALVKPYSALVLYEEAAA